MNQRGFDNQPSEWVGAKEASRLLGVKQPTVYAYASRGLLGRGKRGPGQPAQYLRTAVLRLKARAEARSGHTAVAAGALRWGEPVLDSAITEITEQGPAYRGKLATSLVGEPFEAVAGLLWTGELGRSLWGDRTGLDDPMGGRRRGSFQTGAGGRIGVGIQHLAVICAQLGVRESVRYGLSPQLEQQRARSLIRSLAASIGRPGRAATVAEQLDRDSTPKRRALIDRCLVLSADHELNASTFAARVAAGAGADLHSCLTAALATLSGPRHGGACDRVEGLLADALATSPRQAVLSRLARGETLAGFDVAAYPQGDPRTAPLLEGARKHGRSRRLSVLFKLIDVVQSELGEHASLDLGLVAAAVALELPAGFAACLFAIGRTARWQDTSARARNLPEARGL